MNDKVKALLEKQDLHPYKKKQLTKLPLRGKKK
jgi:hypothetical protein